MSRPIITLTTDFGQSDSYVGTMKGVMLSLCPDAALVDISHEIEPQAVKQAAYVLSTAAPYFPSDTVHLVVVDPGVGSERRPLAVQTDRAWYVAPDNGVLSLALEREPARLAVHLTERRHRLSPVSATFHGRDIFAPAAAYLACGAAPEGMGEPIDLSELVTLPSLQPQQQPNGSWLAEIVHIDRFGNLITSLQIANPQASLSVTVGRQHIEEMSLTFANVEPGEVLAYVGSSGHLEIAVRNGNAARALGVGVGTPIQVEGLP
jgi:S-adenosylmethionine hydrolase